MRSHKYKAKMLAVGLIFTGVYGATQQLPPEPGVPAELRSSSVLIPAGTAGAQVWTSDAAQGFRPVATTDNTADPMLAGGTTSGIKLPISPTTTPATCGQMAMAASGTVYIAQAVVDTTQTPSTNRGVLRTAIDPATGAFTGTSAYIATTAGLDGPQATAAALGLDGNLYGGFLKSGDAGVTSDASNTLDFAVANTFPGGSEVWRYVPSTGFYTFASQSGADRNGANASNFSFVAAKANMLSLDASGNLWIGDDASNATVQGAGRIWTSAIGKEQYL